MNLAELQQRFLAGLERRLAEMEAELDTTTDAESLMRKFHSLTGIAGTYGYHRVTEISRECELLCLTVMEESRTLTDQEHSRLKGGVESARQCAMTPPFSAK
jgi:chemotaxis protein histidine kinase CheA